MNVRLEQIHQEVQTFNWILKGSENLHLLGVEAGSGEQHFAPALA